MGGAVEEGKRLLLAINDLRGGAGGGKVRGSAEGGVGDAGGQRRPPIKRNLLLTQLSRQQRYRQAEGDRERLGQSARVRDSRQLLKAVPAEKPASRGQGAREVGWRLGRVHGVSSPCGRQGHARRHRRRGCQARKATLLPAPTARSLAVRRALGPAAGSAVRLHRVPAGRGPKSTLGPHPIL